jgi:hypothetical protein
MLQPGVDADAFMAGFVIAEHIGFGAFVGMLGFAIWRRLYAIVTGA